MVERSATMAEAISRHRFSVEDYHRMVEAGILTENDPVELIRGELVVMAPIGSPHAASVTRLTDAFDGLRARVFRSTQNPVWLADSEPEPDFQLLVRKDDYYASGHPKPADVYLLVEVADSSLRFDREVKGPLYAENGIREYWLVDIEGDAIEVRRRPEDGRYRELRTVRRGETIAPEAFPDFEVAADAILP